MISNDISKSKLTSTLRKEYTLRGDRKDIVKDWIKDILYVMAALDRDNNNKDSIGERDKEGDRERDKERDKERERDKDNYNSIQFTKPLRAKLTVSSKDIEEHISIRKPPP